MFEQPISDAEFVAAIGKNRINQSLLERLPLLDLPQCTLTAGCLFQTIWNLKSDKAPEWGIKDYDVFYFDGRDLSWDAEDAAIRKAKRTLGALAGLVEIKNQARVHLWYAQKFGAAYPPLTRVEDGIDRFLISCTRFAIRVSDGSVYAPGGFGEMANGILRMNPLHPQSGLFRRKCAQYRARWPWLTVA